MYITLAWRNIWRNKRRTLITIASVFFALWLALIMRAMQTGSYKHMANGIVEAFTGSIQIGSTTIDENSGCSLVSLHVNDQADNLNFNETILTDNHSMIYTSIMSRSEEHTSELQ